MTHSPEDGAQTGRGAALLVRLVLAPRSMVVMDLFVIGLGLLAMVYGVLRFLNILGPQSFIQDCDFTLDVFDGIADVFVFYGVALESRAYLVKRIIIHDSEETALKLDGVSEHTGIHMVVTGLLIEMSAQFGKLATDLKLDVWMVFPMCVFGFVIVAVTLRELIHHFLSVLRARRTLHRQASLPE